MPSSRASTCFVPGCKGGYRSCSEKLSVFKAPKDLSRREQWARNIKRADKELTRDSVVCERHFDASFIERTYRHIINDAPKYFTKKAPVKRKDRNICEQRGPAKKRQKPNSVSRQEPEAHVQEHEDPNVLPGVETSDAVHADAEVQRVCGNLRLPDETWNKLTFCSERDSALYGVCELEGEQVDHILLPKFVKFKANSSQQNSLCCFVYLRGKLHSQCTVSSPEEAQSVLDSTHALALCQGCGMRPEKQGQYVLFAGNYFSAKCTYVCESGSCIHCKYLRKLVQNQMSRKRRSGGMYKRQKKLANTRRSLRTAQKKLLNAERELAAMRQANQQIADEVLGARIKSLPEKQQMAVRACFEADTRKSTSGMLYEKEWILECVLLRMRSPKLYEQLRKQKVLILPSRTCLQRYTRSFKSGFGFNRAVFNALAIKTKDMDISSRHGGIIFDEMKLAEHFNVSAAGTVEGFVDLGKFTQEEDRTTPADHGMVMMFQPFQGDWTQILGVFSSKGNIKAEMLAKLLLEAILLSEQAGLFVDFVSCDGATWNRSMWRSFGIGASSVKTTCNVTHPVDPSRKLHFCSDFPHLVKCVRNSFVSTGFTTQDGRVCVEDIEAAWEKDKSSLTLKAMPHITRVHIRPNSFEKMKVNLAFTLFSDEVLKGMFLFASDIDEISRSKLMPTVELVKRMSRLIAVITSSILPQEVKRLFGNVAPSVGHGLRVCKILKAEWYRQARPHKQYLSALLFDRLEDTVAMQQLRQFQRLADQSTEFLWARQLPVLHTGVAKKVTDQKPTVHVPEQITVPPDILRTLSLGPKFAVEPKTSPPELLAMARNLSHHG
ncbi:hypothetical protein HPB51_027284 [Rhipicephalus microplus]|uniref:THAP-type domain-containing protein n=1 Tax=Rhipicephalus microplus TaxID=6941 RepID=A0A9J6D0H1_RHIMP|nr:hypothetical protein HPB51_027284 [Rhipicephalus microplus]